MPTTLFHLFVDEDPDCFTGLRPVYAGGERMSPVHASVFPARNPGLTLVNGYGPAGSCMHATSRAVGPEDCEHEDDIPLGEPVPRTQVVVLDPDGRRCPAGRPGEIHVTGEGLALGYLGEPGLTDRHRVHPRRAVGRCHAGLQDGHLGYMDSAGTLHFRGRTATGTAAAPAVRRGTDGNDRCRRGSPLPGRGRRWEQAGQTGGRSRPVDRRLRHSPCSLPGHSARAGAVACRHAAARTGPVTHRTQLQGDEPPKRLRSRPRTGPRAS
ncbi:AMP-binding protein [Streptomyces sp. SR-10]|uniref:AMP-binding protein n=1 Tax=Streptomyces sp. SR-10 TaxID=3416442 RepID=UPI003CEE04D3